MSYRSLLQLGAHLLSDEPTQISLLANASAFLNENIDQINWVGFYLYDGQKLTLGPFQGKVACNIIKPGLGVCGTALSTQETQVVDDVHVIYNHIVCDENSQSEVVIPIIKENRVFGVLDVDSPIKARFDKDLVKFLEDFVEIIIKRIDF